MMKMIARSVNVVCRQYGGNCLSLGSRAQLATSVNPEELRKFGRIGKSWWDKASKDGAGPLHDMNPVRVQFIREELAEKYGRSTLFVGEQLKGLDILDVGCGGGLLSESLARLGANMTSIDPAPENIEVASWHAKLDPQTKSIDYQNTTVEAMAQTDKKFDVVCSLEVLEHVDDVRGFLQACFQCVKPNGSVILSTLNKTRKSYLVAIAGAEYITGLVPVGTHDWHKFIPPQELQHIIEHELPDINTQVITKKGLVLQPQRDLSRLFAEGCMQWKLSDHDLDVNYLVHCLKL